MRKKKLCFFTCEKDQKIHMWHFGKGGRVNEHVWPGHLAIVSSNIKERGGGLGGQPWDINPIMGTSQHSLPGERILHNPSLATYMELVSLCFLTGRVGKLMTAELIEPQQRWEVWMNEHESLTRALLKSCDTNKVHCESGVSTAGFKGIMKNK